MDQWTQNSCLKWKHWSVDVTCLFTFSGSCFRKLFLFCVFLFCFVFFRMRFSCTKEKWKKKSKTEQQRTGTSRYKWNCRAMRELTIKILMSSVVFTAAQTALASLRMVCVSPPELSSHEIYVCSCNNTVSARSSRRVVTWQSQYPPARHYQQQTFQLNQQRPLFFLIWMFSW